MKGEKPVLKLIFYLITLPFQIIRLIFFPAKKKKPEDKPYTADEMYFYDEILK
jgi:hypothetical protein